MEDDNHLELSLALPCGGENATVKGKIGSSSDTKSDVSDRDTKLINEFKHFLDGGTKQISSGSIFQKKPENFFNNLSNNPIDVDTSKNLNGGGFWIANDRSNEVGEESRSDIGEKRKNLFGENSQQRKREREADHGNTNDRARTSHISINTDDGSTAENEDVADSEADALTSRQLLHRDNVAKRNVGLSQVHKDLHGVSDSNAVELRGQRRFTISSEKEFKFGNMPHGHGVQFNNQPVNIINMSQPLSVKETYHNGVPARPTYPLTGVSQPLSMAAANNERPKNLPGMPVMVGYSSVQLPTLDKDNSRSVMSHHQQIHQPYISRSPLNLDKQHDTMKIIQGVLPKSSELKQHEVKAMDHPVGNGKQPAGGTSDTGADTKGINTTFRQNDPTELPKTDELPSEYPSIKPGIAAELKFGGSGSYPNLPWVSTTGSGPNGRTISGVTYKYSPTQIRIVCACHGSHMSPEEFVRHASEEQPNEDTSSGPASTPTSNPAASDTFIIRLN